MPIPPEVSSSSSDQNANPAEPRGAAADVATKVRRVAACVDASGFAEKTIPHALTVAAALESPVTFLRVVEMEPTRPPPLDPVEWDIRLREARDEIEELADDRRSEARIDTEVIEGEAAKQISLWTRRHRVGLTVLCTHGDRGVSEWGLGSTAQKLIDRIHGALLLVPCDWATPRVVHYRRLLVPLDGSSHAESALSLAISLARAEHADLLLTHVVPDPELTETGPLENEAIELRERLIQRNERVAHDYLDRMRAQVDGDLTVRTLLLRGGNVRSGLIRAIADEAPDLVLLAAHGHGRRSDVPFGSVAAYLITHSSVPLLIVRGRPTHLAQRAAAMDRREPARLPDHAE